MVKGKINQKKVKERERKRKEETKKTAAAAVIAKVKNIRVEKSIKTIVSTTEKA